MRGQRAFIITRRAFGRDVSSSAFVRPCDGNGTYDPAGRYVRVAFGARVAAVVVAVPVSHGRRAAFIADCVAAADALSARHYRSIAGPRVVDAGAVVIATGHHPMPTDTDTFRSFIDARDALRRTLRSTVARVAAGAAFMRTLADAADAPVADAPDA
jgi:hypothetical protein